MYNFIIGLSKPLQPKHTMIKIDIDNLKEFEDDSLDCAEFDLSITSEGHTAHFGRVSLLWYDSLAFLHYFDESERAYNELVSALIHEFHNEMREGRDNKDYPAYNRGYKNWKRIHLIFENWEEFQEDFEDRCPLVQYKSPSV